jgi:hypothetical protein
MSAMRRLPIRRGNARRAAAADEDAARALGQAVVGAALGDADVRRGGELEPAADHRAVQHGDDRHAAELDRVERRMPVREWMIDSATSRSCSSERSRPAQKCSPSPLSTTARDLGRQVDEGSVQRRHQRIVDRVALGRTVETDVQDRPEVSRRSRSRARTAWRQCAVIG